ncbi:two-component regulator propeller domain-containing protein [Akkermansia sp. N21116]|uniref:ligand-binding sensor domain-containing protein n=1 Tax=Akkermansia sp. N21116 TaxID=3040764 RepID=UPI00244E6C3F|nr:two-component regulator propeller domain-containing protein [Akkermansia sp. N21116]WPX41336.1 two-component regulator propeller domain-containing protein [Akkermansia sp. N21116]
MKSLLSLVFSLFVCGSFTVLGQSMPNADQNQNCPVLYITDGLISKDGSIWIVGEKSGIYRGWISEDGKENWMNANYYEGCPETENVYCVAEDKQGRIWIGTGDQGVFVFNGVSWKQYDRESALPGERIFDIVVSQETGQVAIATSAGLVLYNPEDEKWSYLSRAEGLISDQIEAASFAQDGTLWIAYACGGVAQVTKEGQYKEKSLVQAPWYRDKDQKLRSPVEAMGDGLPSNLCNSILCGPGGYVWVATDTGIALFSKRQGWKFIRGEDYWDKNMGISGLVRTSRKPFLSRKLLPEDYVTSMSLTSDGLWVGFRDRGAALVKPSSLDIIRLAEFPKEVVTPWVTGFIPLPNGSVYAMTYGNGLINICKPNQKTPLSKNGGMTGDINHPQPPPPREWASLKKEADEFRTDNGDQNSSCPVVYWKEDWATKGWWCHRYGNYLGILCGANFGFGSQSFSLFDGSSAKVGCRLGNNRPHERGVQTGLGWIHNSEDPNSLHNPFRCTKSYGLWSDAGGGKSIDGPDLWLVVQVTEEIPYELTMYFYNNEAMILPEMARRDLLVEIRKYKSKMPDEISLECYRLEKEDGSCDHSLEQETDQILKEPVLARTRVKDISVNGVYKTFLLRGPGMYYVRIARNYSQSARINGVFISRLHNSGLLRKYSKEDLFHEYQGIDLFPLKKIQEFSQEEHELVNAWDTVNRISLNPLNLAKAHRWSIDAYRSQNKNSFPSQLSSLMRWSLKLWNERERELFDKTLLQSWYKLQEYNGGAFLTEEYFPQSPRVLPVTVKDLEVMNYLNLEWKDYFSNNLVDDTKIKALRERLESVTDEELELWKNNPPKLENHR